MKEFRTRLKSNGFYGRYFDRKSDSSEKICNDIGSFSCEGRFDEDDCFYNCRKDRRSDLHVINPYESPEAR